MRKDRKDHLQFLQRRVTLKNMNFRLRRWLATNRRTKIGVFIFTLILWIFVILNNRYIYSYSARLEVRNIEPGKTLKEKLPSRIQANFSGKGFDLFNLMLSRSASFKFIVDCQSIRWHYNFQLNDYFRANPNKILIPRNISAEFEYIIWPETLQVELDYLDTVKLPIVPDLEMQLQPGYIKVGEPLLIPDSVLASGPRSRLTKITQINTPHLIQRNASSSFVREVTLISPDPNIKLSLRKVRLTQKIDQLGERRLMNIPVVMKNLPAGIRVELVPASVSIKLSAGVEILKTLNPNDIEISIDYAQDWHSLESRYSPTVVIPAGVLGWSELTPEQIEVRVIREK